MQTQATVLPRFTGAMVFSAATTCALLLLMHNLISGPGNVPDAAEPLRITRFLPVIEDIPPIDTPPPTPPQPIEPPPPVVIEQVIAGGGVATEIVNPPPPLEGYTGPVATAAPDGDILPIFKVRPVYPRRAETGGLEGYVLVRFTVDEAGRVLDPEVVEAQPAGVFNRSALEAVSKFRYRPRVVNGHPTRVTGLLHRLTYEIDGT